MRYIITESQYENIIKTNYRLWLMRRLDSVRDELADALYDIDPCNYTTFDGYESRISAQILDGLHYLYYLDDNFDLKRVKEELIDMFYVDITERYFEGITNC